MRKFLILIGALFATALLSSGQETAGGKWDGYAGIDAGSNFTKGNSTRQRYSYSSGGISGWGRYRTDKFMIRLDLQCLTKYTTTSTTGVTTNAKNLNVPTLNFDIKFNDNKVFEERAGILMEFTPDDRNLFSLNLKQKFNRLDPNKIGISFQNIINRQNPYDIQRKFYMDAEEGVQSTSGYNVNASWNHKFDNPCREITSGMGWELNINDTPSIWNRLESDMDTDTYYYWIPTDSGIPMRTFRFTPRDKNNSVTASVLYQDRELFDLKSLHLELGANFQSDYKTDNLSAANLVGDVWVDSLEYRENFNFLALNLAPKAKLSYSSGKFSFSLQLTPDFYLRKLDSDHNIGSFNFGRVYLLPDFNATWTPSPMHKAGISYKQGLTRPSYLQICWFQRAGAYANEIQMGNPELKPSSNGAANLYYTFHSGFFTGTIEGTTRMNWDKIERVFNTRDKYRIYTWINSGQSIENRIKLTMLAKLKCFNAELGGYYNYFLGVDNAGNETRSSDWGVNGDATLTLKGGWVFNVKGRYQSKIIRTYSSMTEYVGCDVRITKNFKKFSVFAEGKDLFDRPIKVSTLSEDLTYIRVEEYQYNRRIFSVGASFRFSYRRE